MSGLFVGSPFWQAMAGASTGLTGEGVIATALSDFDADNFTESGGNVATAPDSGGGGNDLTVNGTLAYTSSDAALNNHASVTGGSGYLKRATFSGGALTQPTTIYVVGTWCATGASKLFIDGGGSSTRNSIYASGAVNPAVFGGSALVSGSTVSAATKFIAKFVANGASSSALFTVDGSSDISLSGDAGSVGMNGATILAINTGANQWDGKFARAIIFEGVLSDAQNTVLLEYLKTAYSVAPA